MLYSTPYGNVDSLKLHLDSFRQSFSTDKSSFSAYKLPAPILMLAPLAGYTDLPFRRVVKHFGVDITVSEMISSHAIVYDNAKTMKMMMKNDNEIPFSLQISGSKEDIIIAAIDKINNMPWVDIIDFNCGCPAPKVANNGNGSALLKDLDKFCNILRLIRAHGNKKIYSVKVRLGFDKKIPHELAHAINESGVDYCVVHARTKRDAYKADRIDYDSLAQMKEILKIPLIANGDIDSIDKFKRVMQITNADGAMIGRLALKTPWIFAQLRNDDKNMPNILKRDFITQHLDSMFNFYGDRGVIMFRKNLHAYAKGQRDSNKYKDFVNSERDYIKIRESIIEFFGEDTLDCKGLSPMLNKKSI